MLKKICSCKNKHGFWYTDCGFCLYHIPIFIVAILLWYIFTISLGLFGFQFIKLDNINCNTLNNREMMADCFAIGIFTSLILLLIIILIIGIIIGIYEIYKNGYIILTIKIIIMIIAIYITLMAIGNSLCKLSQDILNINHVEPFYHIKYTLIGFIVVVMTSLLLSIIFMCCTCLIESCIEIYNKNKEILQDEYAKKV